MEINGEPWFVGKDVANILGYENGSRDINRHVDSEDRQNYQNGTFESPRGMTVINESGLYSLILSSKLPRAKEFKHWVTSEVLPAIRKHGGYLTPQKVEEALLNPDTLIKLATTIKEERAKNAALSSEIALLTPKAEFYDAVANSESLFSMRDVAITLGRKGFGRNNIFKLLRDRGILDGNNLPYQRFVDAGYFKVNESTFQAGDNTVISKTTYVLQRGIDFIRRLIGSEVMEEMA